jgi:protein tyrosine phosphatase (PTP) superfamily phosphohydrolase (DUF442 family)
MFDPAEPGRTTYSPPRLQNPTSPFLPPAVVPNSPGDLPSMESLPPPYEAQKIVEPDANRSKKLFLTPEDRPEASNPSRDDRGLPVPDRRVLLDPVNPNIPSDPLPSRSPDQLPTTTPVPYTANASPKPERVETSSVGLPAFTAVPGLEKVASGRKPTLDGLNWLQQNGYRTVIYIHKPDWKAVPAAELCEARGMKFVGIPVSANRMSEAAKAFDAALADTANRPLYVCDDTGLWAGTLWYAHFRAVGLVNPDAAKVRATALGLGDPDTNAEQKKLWNAVTEYLRTR